MRDPNVRGRSRADKIAAPSTLPTDMTQIQMTGAELERLQAELAELEGPRRSEIVEAIAVARGHGDLSENFEYHAAKNEQGLLERQITILRAKIEDVVIVDSAGAGEVIGIGSRVVVESDDGDRIEVTISNAGGEGAVSPDSPLGSALFGKSTGDRVKVKAPAASWTARIVSVS
jgi:transcription elongation factor GreA